MDLTIRRLKSLNTSPEGIKWFKANKLETVEDTFRLLIKEKKWDWARWLLKVLPKTTKVKVAVYSAKLVLLLFENKYPKDDRPRKAIKAVEAWLKDPSKENEETCRLAAG